MLVLSRRPGQEVVFPDLGIKVRLIKSCGKQVRIGIEAPSDVHILRGELSLFKGRGSVLDRWSELIESLTGLPNSESEPLETLVLRLGEKSDLLETSLTLKQWCALMSRVRELESLRAESTVDAIQASSSQIQVLNASESTSLATVEARAKRRALVVDDNSNESRLLAGYLRLKEFEVEVASNGAEALKRLQVDDIPDMVLLDMIMPEFDGKWAVEQIRKNERLRDLKVFAISGTSPSDIGVSLDENGVNAWFPKPIDPGELVSEIYRFENYMPELSADQAAI